MKNSLCFHVYIMRVAHHGAHSDMVLMFDCLLVCFLQRQDKYSVKTYVSDNLSLLSL